MDENKNLDRNELGKKAAVDGFAHELILTGILMKRYLNVSLVDLPLSEYDILVVFYFYMTLLHTHGLFGLLDKK